MLPWAGALAEGDKKKFHQCQVTCPQRPLPSVCLPAHTPCLSAFLLIFPHIPALCLHTLAISIHPLCLCWSICPHTPCPCLFVLVYHLPMYPLCLGRSFLPQTLPLSVCRLVGLSVFTLFVRLSIRAHPPLPFLSLTPASAAPSRAPRPALQTPGGAGGLGLGPLPAAWWVGVWRRAGWRVCVQPQRGLVSACMSGL